MVWVSREFGIRLQRSWAQSELCILPDQQGEKSNRATPPLQLVPLAPDRDEKKPGQARFFATYAAAERAANRPAPPVSLPSRHLKEYDADM